jgi:hypothetical protein
MGLFGGKSEDELRAVGTPTTARVTYVDDTGKRREGGAEAKLKIQLKIDSGAARGRDLEKAKWVPTTRMPHVGETVSIRFDPDHVDDWAWGDAAMYTPAAPAVQPGAPGMPAAAPGMPPPMQGAGSPPSNEPMVEFIENAAGPWGHMPGFKQLVEQAMSAGHVTFDQAQIIDARGNPQLREQWLAALKAQGVDVEAMQAGGIPMAGVPPAQPAIPAAAPGAASTENTTERLRKLDALLEQGLVTPDEHREQRQRIIDSI